MFPGPPGMSLPAACLSPPPVVIRPREISTTTPHPMPTKPLRIGLIGYGFMGRAHSNAYAQVKDRKSVV